MLAAAILNALPEEEETLEDSLRRYLSEHTLRMEVHAYAHAKDFWEARQQRYFELIFYGAPGGRRRHSACQKIAGKG